MHYSVILVFSELVSVHLIVVLVKAGVCVSSRSETLSVCTERSAASSTTWASTCAVKLRIWAISVTGSAASAGVSTESPAGSLELTRAPSWRTWGTRSCADAPQTPSLTTWTKICRDACGRSSRGSPEPRRTWRPSAAGRDPHTRVTARETLLMDRRQRYNV